MSSWLNRNTLVLAALGAAVWCAPAEAQYPYPYPYPPVYAPYAGTGGTLAGSSQVIGAMGNFQNQQQQAQITHQQALQEQLKTKKMEFDWKQYEAANTPTFGEVQQQHMSQKVFRVLNNPSQGEIASGEAHNVLLPYLQQLAANGVQGFPVPIQPWILDSINVVTPYAAGSTGILSNGGQLNFPIVLKGETQQRISQEVPQAVTMCVSGTLDFKFFKQVQADVNQLRQEHKKKFHKDEIDGSDYLIGTRYLDELEKAVMTLQQPGTAKLLNGTFKAKGSSVPELVYNMTQQGLKFAPAASGKENAYTALFSAMQTFVASTQQPSGFQVQNKVPYPPKKG
jgi:hypothetical protein